MRQALALLLSFFAFNAFAQEKEYFTARGQKTNDISKSSFYIVGSGKNEPNDGKVLSYYTATNSIRSEYNYREGKLDGEWKLYHENGILKRTATYQENKLTGIATDFYPNGTVQRQDQYTIVTEDQYTFSRGKMLSYRDSVGNELVANGNGFCKCYSTNYNDEIERHEGTIKDGLKDGTWKIYIDNKLAYEDNFSNGEFVNGTNYRKGAPITYTELEKRAEFNGGTESMMRFIRDNLVYPKKARRLGIDGKVFVEFTVEKDGTPTNAQVIKGVDPTTVDAEAIRVINIMPKWIPGYQRGVPVRSKFVLPITFRLR